MSSVAFKIEGGAGRFAARELWRGSALKRTFANPVFHEGHLYGYDGGALVCVTAATGEPVWKQPLDAVGLVFVDDDLVLLQANGELIAVPASPRGFAKRIGVAVMASGSQTSPSFADGSFYVRNLEAITRVDVR